MNPLLERITIDLNVCSGKPCIKGTRIWISLILDFLADRMTTSDIIAEYPYLEEDDILAAIAYRTEAENWEWANLTAQQFSSGYAAADSIYDNLYD